MTSASARRSVAATLCALCTSGLLACREQIDNAGPAPQTVPIRRLTNAEYMASVADLFPGYTLPEIIFVPDPKVLGFVNLSSSQTGSLVRMEQYESAAFSISQTVAADPTTLTGCDAAAQDEASCVGPYLDDFGKRAYRRPLTPAERSGLLGLLAANAETIDYPTRLAMVVQAVLMSPKFLFRPEVGDRAHQVAQGVPLTSWEVATRLSYFLTGSLPDAELAGAADADLLRSPDDVLKQAKRLLTTPRAQTQLVKFHTMWLGTDTISALAKEEHAFPDFNPLIAYYMGKETDTFLRRTLFDFRGTYAQLLLWPNTYLNAPLAEYYGVDPPENDWDPVQTDPNKRLGLLTQGSLLATMAKQDRTDPVRRGKFVLNQILCRNVNPPSPEIVAMFKPLDLSKTAREQFTEHRVNAACASCHNTLDPLGLPFEHYDGIGRWRDDDRGMPIDATGQILDDAGVVHDFDGIPQMAELLSNIDTGRACYAQEWMRFVDGRLTSDAMDKPYIDWLMTHFTRNTAILDMVGAMVRSDAFRYRAPAVDAP